MIYSRRELIDAIGQAGIAEGDTVSLQVSVGRLGLPVGVDATMAAVSEFVADTFLEAIGPEGTLIVPTYTYSIGRGDLYEVESTPSAIGDFTELFRKRAGVIRSRDPMLSSAGIGPKAGKVLRDLSQSCYGEGSTFLRLREVDAKICTVGVALYYATFRHHIEKMARVPSRFDKKFTGTVREGGADAQETWTYFAAPLGIDNCMPDGLPLEHICKDQGAVGVGKVGRGEVLSISARDYYEIGLYWLNKEPWLTAKGPPAPDFELFANEPQWRR